MRYNFENLKTVQCFNVAKVRIPARWDKSKKTPRGKQSFWEDDEETGTLFVGYDLYEMPGMASEIDTRKFVHQLVDGFLKEATDPYSDSMILTVPEGYVWRARYDDSGSQGQLRGFQYVFFLFREKHHATVDFTLVLPFEVLNDDEILDLLGIMDREILAARLDPFNGLNNEKDAYFPVLKTLNLAESIEFTGPKQLTGYADLECRWYFYLEPDDVAARLWVSLNDFGRTDKRLMESWNEAGMRAIKRTAPGLTDRADWQYDIDERPDGFVLHAHHTKISDLKSQVHSEPGQVPLPTWMAGALQQHIWGCFRYTNGKARMAQFVLTFSDARADDPKLQALIRLFSREIPRTTFPGLE